MFFLHILTISSLADTYIEFDYHCFIILIGSMIAYKSILFLFRPRRFQIKLSSLSILIGVCLLYITIHSVFKGALGSKIYLTVVLLVILYGQFSLLLAKKAVLIALSLMLLVGSIVVQLMLALEKFPLSGEHLAILNLGSGPNACFAAAIYPFTANLIFIKIENIGWRNSLKWLAIMATGINTYLCVASTSRTGWVAITIGILVVLLSQSRYWNLTKRMKLNTLLKVVTVCIGAVLFAYLLTILYQHRPGSVNGRFVIYEVGLHMVSLNPLFGTGLGSFEHLYNLAQADLIHNMPIDRQMLADNTFFPFNEYLRIGIELGAIGVGLFICLNVEIFRRTYALLFSFQPKADDLSLATGAAGSLVAIMICCISSYPLHILSVSVLSVFYLAVLSRGAILKAIDLSFSHLFGLIIGLAMARVVYSESLRMWALSKWEEAAALSVNNQFKEAEKIYKEVNPLLNQNGRFLYNYGAEMFISGRHQESIGILEKSKSLFSHSDLYLYLGRNYDELRIFEQAQKHYSIASKISPSKFIPKQLLMDFYIKYDKKDLAQAQAREILSFPVKVPSDTISQIKFNASKYLKSSK